MPEAWLRGPVEGVPAPLQPIAHAWTDALEELEGAAADLGPNELWHRPGGAASVGFHLRHVAGSTERLLAYAAGRALTPAELDAARRETEPGDPPADAASLLTDLRTRMASAMDTLRAILPDTLPEPRTVGRAALPSTVQGLLFHAAEHARRHAGQAIATAQVVRAARGSGDEALGRTERALAERVRDACVKAALDAWEDAGLQGLCGDGRWEVAIGRLRRLPAEALLEGPRRDAAG